MELTDEQVRIIIKRQKELEFEILGNDIESSEYVFWTNGGFANFWKVWVWDYLGIPLPDNDSPLENENKDLNTDSI